MKNPRVNQRLVCSRSGQAGYGGVTERPNVPVLKTGDLARGPRVQISPPPPNPYVAPFSSHSPFISAPDSHASAVPGLRPIPGISTSAYSFILAYTHTPALRLLRSVRLGIQLPYQDNVFSHLYT